MDGFNLLQVIVTGAFSAGVTYGALHTRLVYIERDLQELRRKVFNFEKSDAVKL
jgi:hypothetical protein